MPTEKMALRTLIAAAACGGCLAADLAAAAEIEEVVVQARRRDESIQTTPVAVTALSPAEVEQRGITEISGVAQATPNLNIMPAAGTAQAAILQMRGQVQNDQLISLDPSVGVYVDDIYAARAYGVLSDLVDIERIEVVKGPQGTLYGRNTTGGALKVITRRADPDAGLHGFLKLGGGDYSTIYGSGAVNIPIADNFAVRLAAAFNKRDGYNTGLRVAPGAVPVVPAGLPGLLANINGNAPANLTPVEEIDLDNRDSKSFRANATWNVSDALTVWLSGDYFKDDTNGQLTVNRKGDLNAFGGPPLNSPANFAAFGPAAGLVANAVAATSTLSRTSPQRAADFHTALINLSPYANVESWGISATGEYRFNDNLATKLILAYREASSDSFFGPDGGVPAFANPLRTNLDFTTQLDQSQQQVSVEWQVAGKALDSRLDWLAGVYYFQEEGHDNTATQQTSFFRVTNNLRAAEAENDSLSFFGHGSFQVTDKLRFNGGVRYTMDSKGIVGHNTQDFLLGATDTTMRCVYFQQAGQPGVQAQADGLGPCSFEISSDFDFVSWTAGFDYQFDDGLFGYIKTSTSTRSGGQQIRAADADPVNGSAQPFEPETATDVELGLKIEALDRRLRANFAAFRTFYTDVQFSNVTPVRGVFTTFVDNVGDATVNGVEFETTFIPFDGLTLIGSVGYVNVDFDDIRKFGQRTPCTTLTGNPLNGPCVASRVPEWQAGASVIYSRPVPIGEASVRLDWSYLGTMAVDTSGDT
ncbi:MAG: TonB-dependent receptor [Gammaproteobacteria bacterium]